MLTSESLIARYIEPDPYSPGAENARIKGTGLAVWALVAYLEALGGDLPRTAREYDLAEDAVRAAVAYYQENSGLIDRRIADNAA